MIVTKKMWLRWPDDDFFDGIAVPYENDDFPEWVFEEPKKHNGVLEVGDIIEPDDNFVSFGRLNGKPHSGPDFSMKELFKFIKDGTFQLKGGK